ncbi:MAG: hypothetical protein LAN62_09090 [Acidobacteriia bacterium]|nr:hypothetical protein [Terriglobia bacterium]
MNAKAAVHIPEPFMPHPNLSDEVNRNIAQGETEGGVRLCDLSEGARWGVEMHNCWYIAGSTSGGLMLKLRFIARGTRLEFRHPVYRTIKASRIVGIRTSEQPVTNACAPKN